MSIIETIRAEVERRSNSTSDTTTGRELDEILFFLDTLESEHLAGARKTSPEDLEEAANVYSNCYSNPDGALARAARRAYITGAKWQKGQIMKEAVEGHVVSRNDGWNSIELPSTFFGELSKKYKDGDKVRIIIVKEEN